MRRILEITTIESWKDKYEKVHYRTHAILDNGEEAAGYGSKFKNGDLVEAWFDEDWDLYKMKRHIEPKKSVDK
jgi:hypothetical protein